jgi:hypothetical protein
MSELLATVARLRRAMPRNGDVLAVCDALERSLVSRRDGVGPTSLLTPVGPTPEMVPPVGPTPCPECVRRREAKSQSQARRRANAKAVAPGAYGNGAPPS